MQKQTLAEKVISGFKKAAAIGVFALTSLLPYGCASKEAELHRNITSSVLEQGKKKIEEGDLKEAVKYCRKISEIHEQDIFNSFDEYYSEFKDENKEVLDGLVKVYESQNKKHKDEKYSHLDERIINQHFLLGLLYTEKGDKEKGNKYFNSAFEKYEEYLKGKDLLKKTKNSKPLKNIFLLATIGSGQGGPDVKSYGIEVYGADKGEIGGIGFSYTLNGGLDTIVDDLGDTQYWNNEWSFYFLGGGKLQKNLFLIGTIGFSNQSADGQFLSEYGPSYDDSTSRKFTVYSLQLKYALKNLALSIGYDNRREFVFGIGAAF